jgi:putative phosphoesterase
LSPDDNTDSGNTDQKGNDDQDFGQLKLRILRTGKGTNLTDRADEMDYFCGMIRIGILSDTHGNLHPRIAVFFGEVDEIWHAGDIGLPSVLSDLKSLKPVRAVYGNCDGQELRMLCPEVQFFQIGEAGILITHIGGSPGRYDWKIIPWIREKKPHLFVCGHSHILKVQFDHNHRMLYINPGAAGNFGLHKLVTAVRLKVEGTRFLDLEVLDIPR